MREKKWTQAPWHIGPKTATYKVVGPAADTLERYGLPVYVEMVSIGTQDGQIAVIPMDESSMDNAHLIKAAPLLVEVLEKIVDSGTWYSSALEIDLYKEGAIDGEELEKMARFALAKVYGEK